MRRTLGRGIRFVFSLPSRLVKLLALVVPLVLGSLGLGARLLGRAARDGLHLLGRGARLLVDAARHPRRTWRYFLLRLDWFRHAWASRRTRWRGQAVWESVPGLEQVPRAITWAREYRRHQSRFRKIEELRDRLYTDETTLKEVAGRPTVAKLAGRGVTPFEGALLHGLVVHGAAQRALELGTGLGLASLYITRGLLDTYPVRTCALVTLEENSRLLEIAKKNVYMMGFDDVVWWHEGPFKETLREALRQIVEPEFVFLNNVQDGEALTRYFSQIGARCRPGTLIAVNGIHRSPDMAGAWQAIQGVRGVVATVDLWRLGIVVLGEGQPVHLHARL